MILSLRQDNLESLRDRLASDTRWTPAPLGFSPRDGWVAAPKLCPKLWPKWRPRRFLVPNCWLFHWEKSGLFSSEAYWAEDDMEHLFVPWLWSRKRYLFLWANIAFIQAAQPLKSCFFLFEFSLNSWFAVDFQVKNSAGKMWFHRCGS